VSKDTKTLKKKENVMKAMIIAALVALVSVSYAHSPDGWGAGRGAGHGRGMGPGGGEGIVRMLDLDSATAVKVAKLHDEHQKDRIALRAKLETARVEFRAAMRKDPVDEKAALAKRKEMGSIREQLETSALEHRFAVGKLLTPEQRKLLREHAGRGAGAMMEDDRGHGDGRYGDGPMRHHRGDRHPRTEGDDD
jgi:Spy/CpxP family protein refolding chaperone